MVVIILFIYPTVIRSMLALLRCRPYRGPMWTLSSLSRQARASVCSPATRRITRGREWTSTRKSFAGLPSMRPSCG